LIGCIVSVLLLFCGDAPSAQAAFGFKALTTTFTAEGGAVGPQPAGSHPEAWSTTLAFNTAGPPGEAFPDGSLKNLHITLPPGLVGAPALLPECAHVDYLDNDCPASTAVGALSLQITSEPLPIEGPANPLDEVPLYLLEPLPGQAAQLGFTTVGVPVTIDLSISQQPPYNLIASITNVSQAAELFGTTLTLEGTPNGNAFLTLPRSCADPLRTSFSASSWQAPATTVPASAPEPQQLIACGALSYSPSLEVTPTTSQAAAPSGLDLTLSAPDQGIASPSGRANADTSSATVALPAGLTINPPLAGGLAVCAPAQLAAEIPDTDPSTGCPDAAKLGSAEVTTPLFRKPIAGTIYAAEPDNPATATPGAENPFDTRFALYLILRAPERGVLLRLPIRIDPDPESGRLVASFSQIPQLPLDRLELHFNSGPRAPLTTPVGCGSHRVYYTLTPSSGAPALQGSGSFATDAKECNPRFAPDLDGGTTSNSAGRSAPFLLDLSQDGAEPNLSGLSLTLPPGLSAALAGVPTCPEAATAIAACSSNSKLGYARIAIGSGPEPLWVPAGADPSAAVYLAGPYKGAPFSLLISVPSKAGPYDLGTVIIRARLDIDPTTAQISAKLDPLPQILGGVPLHYREIRLVLNRPGLIRNPTSCEPAQLTGLASSAAGASGQLGVRFQAADCVNLGFKPRGAVNLLGPVHRGAHPRLRVVLTPRPGDANLRRAGFTLPASELLDTRHIGKVCTRGAFAAGRCPRGAAYGRVRVRTPLLDGPLSGRVFLRESDNRFPDLAVALNGDVDLQLSGYIDSSRGRLRIVFSDLPDVPFSRLVLTMNGGKRGLLANTGGLCSRRWWARAGFVAQSGKRRSVTPVVHSGCSKARR
jgi:hypothetical protein